MNRNLRGVICTLLSGVFWGLSGACSEYLFTNYDMDSRLLTVIRLLVTGVTLTLLTLLLHRERFVGILRSRSDALQLAAFGLFGLMFSQYSYLTSIKHSNSGTATVLQYVGPVLVVAYVCLRSKRRPTRIEATAIILAVLGTYLLATHGNPRTMVLTPLGLGWGLISAVSVAFYTLLPEKITPKWGSMTVSGMGMLLGGIVMSLVVQAWEIPFSLDLKGFFALASVVVLGTVFAYTMYLQGISDIGPMKASMLASVEPISATLFSVLWLKNSFQLMDFLGFICIITTIFLLTGNSEEK